jgi:peptidylprolyl isomerase
MVACAPEVAPIGPPSATGATALALPPADPLPTPKGPSPSAGVIVTKSGLEYEDLKPGTGYEIGPGQTAVVHYVGTLEDGTKFDSSRDRSQPFQFRVGAGQVIRGWDEGVVGMREGQVRRLRIPSDLAYGPKGRPPKIPPAATLVFEVELLEVR